jgi:hypothetical protein
MIVKVVEKKDNILLFLRGNKFEGEFMSPATTSSFTSDVSRGETLQRAKKTEKMTD